jgi:hypothetical protein
MDQGDLRGTVHKPPQWGLSLLCAGSFGLVHRSVGDLECMWVKILRDLPHTCSCTWCFIQKWKGGNKRDSTNLRTREPYLFKLKYFFGFLFYFHHETYSSKAEFLHQHKRKRIYLQWTLEGWYVPPSYFAQHESYAWLTFPFEFSSTTHPFGFEDFPVGVSPHIQLRSIQAFTLRSINQTWHHV